MQHLREIHEPTLSDSWRNLRLINLFGYAVVDLQSQNFGFFRSSRAPSLSLAQIEEQTLEEARSLAYPVPNDGDSQDAMDCGNPSEPDNGSKDNVHKEVSESEGDKCA